jgi:ATP phosphoribosyltransferase regulatory subunit
MTLSDEILSGAERSALRLRELFHGRGYRRFPMSRFEPYDLYAANRAFLASDDIISFTGSGGALLALRPDVTLSVVKGMKAVPNGLERVYYHENVYRRSGLGREFKESAQVGVECYGELSGGAMAEVTALAVLSLETLGVKTCLDVSHMGLIAAIMDELSLPPPAREELVARLAEKILPELSHFKDKYSISASGAELLLRLAALYGPFAEVSAELDGLAVNAAAEMAAGELRALVDSVASACPGADLRLDFSLVNNLKYYNGVIFQGYADGLPSPVLSGGRYDALLRRFGKGGGAVGFAVYVDLLSRLEDGDG